MLIETLSADYLSARKAKDSIKSSLLGTLVSEAKMVGKNAGNRESTDAEVMSTIKKFIKNGEETRRVLAEAGRDTSVSDQELAILKTYLPDAIDEALIAEAIMDHITATGDKSMKTIMGMLKEKFGASLDGKTASAIVKGMIS